MQLSAAVKGALQSIGLFGRVGKIEQVHTFYIGAHLAEPIAEFRAHNFRLVDVNIFIWTDNFDTTDTKLDFFDLVKAKFINISEQSAINNAY